MLWAYTKFSHKTTLQEPLSEVIDFARSRGVLIPINTEEDEGKTVNQDLSLNLQQSILNASLAGNIDAIVSLFADDAVIMPPNDTTLFGKAEIQAWED